jgi:hypothetical protein
MMMRTRGSVLIDANQQYETFDESVLFPLISVGGILRKTIVEGSDEQYCLSKKK